MIYILNNEQVKQNCIQEIKMLTVGTYEVLIREKKRSNPQNALYWKWIHIIANELGYADDELHEAFKGKFIGMEQGRDVFGNIFIRPKSSAALNKKAFTEYMNMVNAFAMSQNITLPSPDYYGLEDK